MHNRYSFICIWVFLALNATGQSQMMDRPESGYTYHPPSTDKASWQKLNLLLSATFMVVVKEGQVEHDTCFLMASHSLGLSRIPLLAEGIDDPALLAESTWIDLQQPATGIALLSKATGITHLKQLILLGAYYAFQPSSYYRYKDSAEYFLNKAVTESKTLKEEKLGRQALCLLGKIYVQANDPKGNDIFNSVIDECRAIGDKETEARAIAYRGIYAAPNPATFQQKEKDLERAASLYHSLGDTEAEINVLTDLGYMLVVTGQFQASSEILSKALALAESIHFPYTHYITEALANVTFYQGKFGEPFRYTLQTIKSAEISRDSIGWGYFYSRLALLYNSEGRKKESIEEANEAIKRFVTDRDPSLYFILDLVIYSMCEAGRPKEALELVMDISKKVPIENTFSVQLGYHYALSTCYLYLDSLTLAEFHLEKMDSLETKAEMIRGPLRRSIITERQGDIFFRQGKYKTARELYEQHFTIPAYGQRTLMNDLAVYRRLIQIDSLIGDNASGVAHYKMYTRLLDSNFMVTKVRQAEELQVLYETQEKESQIAALNQQAIQTRLVKNLTLTGIAAVIVIAALLFRQSRLRRKTNQIITDQNNQLQDLLADKEWLLKEVHHRVKNNLQIIMSLLDSQSVYIDDDAALQAINDSQRRVQAISLIHQRLYQTENTALIDMPQYIDELVCYLSDSFDTSNRVVFELNIEALKLDVGKAIPVGLIINESIVNAVKYAFPNNQKGKVHIELRQDGGDYLSLSIKDSGVGMPADLDLSQHDSLGFSLIQGLARQLDGTMQMKNSNGLEITIRFLS